MCTEDEKYISKTHIKVHEVVESEYHCQCGQCRPKNGQRGKSFRWPAIRCPHQNGRVRKAGQDIALKVKASNFYPQKHRAIAKHVRAGAMALFFNLFWCVVAYHGDSVSSSFPVEYSIRSSTRQPKTLARANTV